MLNFLLQAGPLPEVDPKVASDTLMESLKTGAVLLAVIAGGILVIYFLNLFLIPNLRGKAKAVVATILIGAAAALSYLQLNSADWVQAILVGLGAGFSAGKLWDLFPEKAKEKMKKPIKLKRAKKLRDKARNTG